MCGLWKILTFVWILNLKNFEKNLKIRPNWTYNNDICTRLIVHCSVLLFCAVFFSSSSSSSSFSLWWSTDRLVCFLSGVDNLDTLESIFTMITRLIQSSSMINCVQKCKEQLQATVQVLLVSCNWRGFLLHVIALNPFSEKHLVG